MMNKPYHCIREFKQLHRLGGKILEGVHQPASIAARVARMRSSTRSLRSLTSTSVAPPTRGIATPPVSIASRSCSFSRSYRTS
jgi:hypothetical protein